MHGAVSPLGTDYTEIVSFAHLNLRLNMVFIAAKINTQMFAPSIEICAKSSVLIPLFLCCHYIVNKDYHFLTVLDNICRTSSK